MSKVVIVPVTGAQNLSAINDNFQTIADALNDAVLFRDNPPGEPNQVLTDVDMNGKRIYNLPQPVSPSEPVRYQDLGDVTALTDTAREYAESAELSSQQATTKAAESTASALAAAGSAAAAAGYVTDASGYASTAQTAATNAANSAIAAEDAASRADRVPQTSATGAAIIPAGTEAQRPSPIPADGLLIRGNTDTGKPEWYDRTGGEWKEFASGGELFNYAWHNGPRSSIDVGRVATDGQQLLLLTHPDVCQAIWAGEQHSVSESVWQSDPTKRNCWSTGDGTSWVRVPDLNAAVAGTGKPFYLRGSPTGLNGASVGDAIRNIVATSQYAANAGMLAADAVQTGAFTKSATNLGVRPSATSSGDGRLLQFDASLVVPTADENRVKTAYGVMTVRVFTEVSNVGALDAGQLATQLGVVDAQVQTLKSKYDAELGFTIIYPNGGTKASPGLISANQRLLVANPFPGSAVICIAQVSTGAFDWAEMGWFTDANFAAGVKASVFNDTIVTQSGKDGIGLSSNLTGSPTDYRGAALQSGNIRVLCFKIKS